MIEKYWLVLVVIFVSFVIVFAAIKEVKNIKRLIRRKIDRKTRDLIGLSVSDINNVINTVKTVGDMMDEMPTVKSVSGATEIYLKQIRRDFPDFHASDAEAAIKAFVSDYLQIKYCGQKNFKNVNMDGSLLQLIDKSSTIKNVQDIRINKIAISGYSKSDEYATVNYQCSVGFNIDNKRVETRFKINYTLRLLDNNIASEALICPNCGATIESTSLTKCEYCNSKIIRDTIFNWIFTSIEEG